MACVHIIRNMIDSNALSSLSTKRVPVIYPKTIKVHMPSLNLHQPNSSNRSKGFSSCFSPGIYASCCWSTWERALMNTVPICDWASGLGFRLQLCSLPDPQVPPLHKRIIWNLETECGYLFNNFGNQDQNIPTLLP